MKDRRIILLDILRMAMALLIFFRHLITLGGCVFEKTEDLILAQTDIVMIAFFCVSGFCINSVSKDFSSRDKIIDFYKSRIWKILPLYLTVELVRFVSNLYFDKGGIESIATLPIRLLGIQIHYSFEVFSGVSWFISCLFVCYFIFPLFKQIISELNCNKKGWLGLVILLLLTYSQIICRWYLNIDMYYNPFFRGMEFVLGVLISDVLMEIEGKIRWPFRLGFAMATVFLLAVYERILLSTDSCVLGFLVVVMIIISASWTQTQTDNIFCKSLIYISSFSFELFILQDILFSTPMYKLKDYFIKNGGNNEKKIFYIIMMLILVLLARFWVFIFKRLCVLLRGEKLKYQEK